jgi:uroporphyrinogen-III decarboxylase
MLKICELNARLSEAAIRIASEVGFQVFYCGTESSLYSPGLVEKFSLPFLIRRRELVHSLGGLFYLHECGRMQGLLDNRFYQRLAPDILEGFQSPPSGDILDMGAAAAQLPTHVVTKGNLDLNFLMSATPAEVEDAGLRVLDKIPGGHRHILGGACCIMPGTPLQSLQAISAAAEKANCCCV